MTKFVKTATFALLLAIVPVAKANAQTYRTNVLIGLTISLTGYEQVYLVQLTTTTTNVIHGITNVIPGITNVIPVIKTSKIGTSAVISAIARHAQITNGISTAKLYWRMSWTNSADNITYDTVIRTAAGDTVVNNWFLLSFPDTVSLVTPNAGGTTNVTDYSHCVAELGTSQGSFTLHGVSTMKSASLLYNSKVVEKTPIPRSFTTTIFGPGNVFSSGGYHQTEWKGTLNGTSQKVEIEQISQ